MPAQPVEDAVVQHLHRHLRSDSLIQQMLPLVQEHDPTMDEAQLTAAMTRLDHIWEQLFHAEQQRIVRLMLEKVIVNSDSLDVRLRASGLHKLVLELEPGEQ